MTPARHVLPVFIAALFALTAVSDKALAQTPAPEPAAAPAAAPRVLKFGLAPKPDPMLPWKAPNRLIYKLSDLLREHAGQKSWSQTLVQDENFTGRYIQMAPGEKTKTLMYAEKEMFWAVQAGAMRVTVDGIAPFIATKGFVVQIPFRTFFSMETVGDAPSLRWEVTHTGALPAYPVTETPTPIRGMTFIRAAYTGPQVKLDPKKIYIDFNKEVVEGGARAGRFLKAGSFIRGMTIANPPDSDQGHFHVGHNEFWYILEGKMNYLIEGAPSFTADQGDVMYAPRGHFHRNSFAGGGMATRLAVFPASQMNGLDPDNPSRQSP